MAIGAGAVLLCSQDLAKDGEGRHRTIVAEWLEEQTGEEVLDL